MAGNGKMDEFKQERMFWKSSEKTHIRQIQGIGRNGFCRLLGLCDIFTHSGHIFEISSHHFLGAKKKEEQTAQKVKASAISDRIAIFGAPGILAAGEDSRFIGGVF